MKKGSRNLKPNQDFMVHVMWRFFLNVAHLSRLTSHGTKWWCRADSAFSFAHGTFVMIFGTMLFCQPQSAKTLRQVHQLCFGILLHGLLEEISGFDSWAELVPIQKVCLEPQTNWMVPNLYRGNGCLTKLCFVETGCLGFQVATNHWENPILTDPLFLASMASTAGRGCAKFPLRSHIPVRVQRQP